MLTSNISPAITSSAAIASYIKKLNLALKTHYQKNNTIPRLFYKRPISINANMKLSIVPDEAYQKQDNSHDLKNLLSPDDLSQASKRGNHVLILGPAGIGKTTLTRYLSYILSITPSEPDDFSPWRKQFKQIILLPLTNFLSGIKQEKFSNAAGFLFSEHLSTVELKAEDIVKINNKLEREDKAGHILWIIDGYDKITREIIVEKNYQTIFKALLKKKNLILMAQDYDAGEFSGNYNFTPAKKFHLDEFNSVNIHQYICNFFTKLNVPRPEEAMKLSDFIKQNSNLASVCSLPGSLELICGAWERKYLQETTCTITELYNAIFSGLSRVFLKRDTVFLEDSDVSELVKREALCLAYWAWESLMQETSICPASLTYHQSLFETDNTEPKEEYFKKLLRFGLMQPVYLDSEENIFSKKFYFSHAILQYYLAAKFICYALKEHPNDVLPATPYTPLEYINKFLYSPRLKIMWQFTAGILWEKKEWTLLNYFSDLIPDLAHLEKNNMILSDELKELIINSFSQEKDYRFQLIRKTTQLSIIFKGSRQRPRQEGVRLDELQQKLEDCLSAHRLVFSSELTREDNDILTITAGKSVIHAIYQALKNQTISPHNFFSVKRHINEQQTNEENHDDRIECCMQ